ncbi:MAG: hypothetical protein KC609_03285 [Myxococcales bacterium]|nr:hypothetical protein [Myxococcales bacterium]
MITQPELSELERRVALALRGDDSEITVLGYGEISLVLGWPAEAPQIACKRLPPFRSLPLLERYRHVLSSYIERLEESGIHVAESELHHLRRDDGTLVGYIVQRVLPRETLGPALLRGRDPGEGHPLIEAIVDAAASVVSERVGLDAQLSNWAFVDGEARYLDVTTPMLMGDDNRPLVDPDLFLAAFPWLIRGPIKRFVLPSILERYHALRTVLLDLCANLVKERLTGWMPTVIDAANKRLDESITPEEADRDYRSDARMWEVMLRLRRLDRAWQRHVRRRVYPFLLPGHVQR